ncbi:hypothetical protein [Paenibacillus lutrae]|uniref:Uncharacterized protein n=1 Tax=Paenibacillus lutrae TaxID=2078573 RepID=A0A7X3JY66_9BACL|nr:hypothetical protein [Paenibacillus lutrae]MVO98644.1 hypothetical protein [Paenibacillus lutrae]
MRHSERFVCLGSPVHADETRSAAVCRAPSGEERLVITARGYVLIVDAGSGRCTQLAFPDGHLDYPFACMSSESGLLYTGAGKKIMVLDPFRERFIYWAEPAPDEEIAGFAFAEDAGGHVYFTTYPGCELFRMDPVSMECSRLTRLHTRQKYAMSLAAGKDGWVYAGIGTAEAGVAAYCLADGTLLHWQGEGLTETVRGSGQVRTGSDGHVYASLPALGESGPEDPCSADWFRLQDGRAAEPAAESTTHVSSAYKGTGYHKLHRDLSGGRSITGYQLSDGELVIREPDGSQTVVPLAYQGNGAALSPMTGGPDGMLYGTSNHPLHLYRYDPQQRKLVNLGGKLVENGGGGNICAYAVQGPYLIGAAYAGGFVHRLDTRLPLESGSSPGRNPVLLLADERIHRPRCAVAHPGGEHVLIGGFPGYGAVGGGLVELNVHQETWTVYEDHEIVPSQSTLCLGTLSSGDVIGGSSIETPGGADPAAKEAALYRLDWRQRRVSERWTPVPGAREISLLLVDASDRVHALTSDSVYFVFDPSRGLVLHRQDLSEWGGIVRQGLILIRDGHGQEQIIGLLSRGIFKVQTDSMKPQLVSLLPDEATSGLAFMEGRLYFGCGSQLWSYFMEEGDSRDEL